MPETTTTMPTADTRQAAIEALERLQAAMVMGPRERVVDAIGEAVAALKVHYAALGMNESDGHIAR